MSESSYPSSDALRSTDTDSERGHRARGPQLGLTCLAVGLGIFLAVVLAALVFVFFGIRSAAGWSAIGFVGLAIGGAFAAVAASAYRRATAVRWWQILGSAFGVGLLLNSINRAARVDFIFIIVNIVNVASIVAMIVGGIVAVIQVSAKPPATLPHDALVAPIVGYTDDGRPVYGRPVPGPSGTQSTNVFAVLALVFGIIGGLLGLVFGHIALSQIRRTGEAGRGMAIAGLALGYITLTFILLGMIGYSIFVAAT